MVVILTLAAAAMIWPIRMKKLASDLHFISFDLIQGFGAVLWAVPSCEE
jgi:hypothetical protein